MYVSTEKKSKSIRLLRKLVSLVLLTEIYVFQENECFQEALRSTQRKLLKVNRDKSFLLDRLLQYEKVDTSFSESDETESSDEEVARLDTSKR